MIVLFPGRPVDSSTDLYVFKKQQFDLELLKPMESAGFRVDEISHAYDSRGFAKFGSRYLGYAVIVHDATGEKNHLRQNGALLDWERIWQEAARSQIGASLRPGFRGEDDLYAIDAGGCDRKHFRNNPQGGEIRLYQGTHVLVSVSQKGSAHRDARSLLKFRSFNWLIVFSERLFLK